MKPKLKLIEASIPIANTNEAQKKVLLEVGDLTEKVHLLLHKFEIENPGSGIAEILFDGEGARIKGKSFRRPIPSGPGVKLSQTICTLVREFMQRNPDCFISKITNSVEGVDVTVHTPVGYGSN